MKVLMYLTIDTPDLESEEDQEDAESRILEGLVSVDMDKAIGECLATWFLSVLDEDVQVSVGDAVKILPSKDHRKLLAFKVRAHGGLQQTN